MISKSNKCTWLINKRVWFPPWDSSACLNTAGTWGTQSRGLQSHSWHPRLKGDYEQLSRALGHWHYCKCVKWLASLKPKLIDYAPTDVSSSLPQSGCCWSRGPSQGVSASALVAALWPIINSGGMLVLPVNGSGSFRQMVSERRNSVSPHRFAVLIVLCLTAHKNRTVARLLSPSVTKFGERWRWRHNFRLISVFLETDSNWIWPVA